MFLGKIADIRRTLAFRLTFMYAFIFTISFLGVFVGLYLIIASTIQGRTDQELLNELAELRSIYALKGERALKGELDIEAESDGVDKVFFRLLSPDASELISSNMSSWADAGVSRAALKRLAGGAGHLFETLSLPGRAGKARILYGAVGPDRMLQIGLLLHDDERFLKLFRETFGISMAVFVVLSCLIGWFMARRALLGVSQVTRTAQDISEGAFEQRVKVKARGDEIERLANVFNIMLDRIHELIVGMKDVTDSIAHDLRSPITRIRGLAELKLNNGNHDEGCEDFAGDTIEECDYLLQMINTMLEISETEAGVAEFAEEAVDVAAVIQKACELFRPIAEDKGVHITSEISGPLYVLGDMHALQRMFVNLLENAIKYTSSGGSVVISVNDDKARVTITFQDTGIGIAEKDLPHIFRRLYRCDRSRSQTGFGLGLSLARAIARAHGGDITVKSDLGKGSLFAVTLLRQLPSRQVPPSP